MNIVANVNEYCIFRNWFCLFAEFSMFNRDAGLHALVPLLLVVMLVDVIVLLLIDYYLLLLKKNDDDDELYAYCIYE